MAGWSQSNVDPQEAAHLAARHNWNREQIGTLSKALGTVSDAATAGDIRDAILTANQHEGVFPAPVFVGLTER